MILVGVIFLQNYWRVFEMHLQHYGLPLREVSAQLLWRRPGWHKVPRCVFTIAFSQKFVQICFITYMC